MKVTLLTSSVILAVSVTLPVILCANSAFADEKELLSDIAQTAEKFALAQVDRENLHGVEAQTSEFDPRLELRKCELPLQASATGNAGQLTRITVAVRCTGANPWTLYVPVRISAAADVVYTVRPMARGDLLLKADVEIRRVDVQQLPFGYLSSIEQLDNMELARPLNGGAVLTLNALKIKQMVQQGQEVSIVAKGSGVSVRMAGKALKNGRLGDMITVRNTNSGRIIQATVLDDSTVEVNL